MPNNLSNRQFFIMFRSLIVGICLAPLLVTGAAIAMEEDTKQLQVSLHTVMNPNGVTQEEWQAMFEGVRNSMREQAKRVNEFIELFNTSFQKLQPKEAEKWMADYKKSRKKDLTLPHSLLRLNDLHSRGPIEAIARAA